MAALCGAIVLAIIASGCAQPQRAPSAVAAPNPREAADRQLAAGRFEAAAQAYANLAATESEPAATTLRLQSALIRRDLNEDVSALVPDTTLADPAQEALRTLAIANALLAAGDAAGAATRLSALTQAAFDPYQRGLYLRTLGRAQLARGEALPALSNLVAAETLPMPEARRVELTHAIWDALQAAGVANAKSALPPEAPHAAGWIALAELHAAQGYDPAAFASGVASWQTSYPDHPAQTLLLAELLDQSEEALAPPAKIALLLPLQGPLANVGEAIRDGFISMRFTGAIQPPPEILVYDVNAANAVATLQTALADGAKFIVGPLEKNALDALLAAGEPPVPMLALNTATKQPASTARLFQFGLRPEDEAIDAAERAWRDGRRRMIAMVPANDLGERVLSAFAARWQALGGTLVDSVRFRSSVQSYADAVRQTFGLAQSEARAAALRRLLQRAIVAEARRRDDVDGILLSAPPVEARQILPQFRFLGAANLPIYATSHVFSGARNPGADQDLNGVMFGDAPWLLGAGDRSLKDVYDRHWHGGIGKLRFFAFGADACRIIPYLAQMRAQPGMRVAGATGRIYVDGGSLVRRELTWARFAGGSPQLLGPSP
ncbi:MAG TPA: penicillin-binding protein activator [Gammaproteobacteria bacterium]|nr:penicillin-binding protein activator [Gammaproteobacteria bacterium]